MAVRFGLRVAGLDAPQVSLIVASKSTLGTRLWAGSFLHCKGPLQAERRRYIPDSSLIYGAKKKGMLLHPL